ncbi:unnamed protein product [Tilletia controversa]|nr:unnamed protein product [Tilletia caries]CAD6896444.1 unnamed protein product [Tilletia controversa]CAD6916496.1 unnamed protein product [Tilletia caries]CAD7069547.1 unnamed protein product [Tilletia caries]
MPLTAISEPPRFIRPDADAPTERATPGTFVGLAPTLRTLLESATALLDPGLPPPSSAEAQGGAYPQWQAQGSLYVTNDSLSFLDPASSKGFSVDFPTVSLHAISRSIPEGLQALAEASGSTACLYCQLDDNAGKNDENDGDGHAVPYGSGGVGDGNGEDEDGMDDDADEEEEADDDVNTLRELWLLPQRPDQHASGGGGHPFASLGAFGTGMLGVGGPVLDMSALSAQGAFDDAMEDSTSSIAAAAGTGVPNGDGAEGLSDTGRAILARLEGSIEWPSENINNPSATRTETDPSPSQSEPKPSSPSPKKKALTITNTLILTSLPDSLFQAPDLLSSLLDLLHAYGPLQSWTPLPSMNRALVVFEDGIEAPGSRAEGVLSRGQESAGRAKEALDRLLWGFEEDGGEVGEEDVDEEEEERLMEWPPKKAEGKAARNGSAMRVYHGPPSSVLLASHSDDALAVPTTDKNFLISPPGSPPVGWEPIKEDPPNRDTLAWDLMKALGDLRDQGGAVHSWKAAPLVAHDEGGASKGTGGKTTTGKMGHGRKGSLGPPSLVIPPSEAKVSRRQAAFPGSTQARPTPFMDRIAQAQPQAHPDQPKAEALSPTDHADDAVLISVPGVTVQAFEDGSDDEDAERRAQLQPRAGMSISSVKATVESMYSPSPIVVPLSDDTGRVEEPFSALKLDSPAGGGLGLGGELGEEGGGGGKRITPTGRPPLA